MAGRGGAIHYGLGVVPGIPDVIVFKRIRLDLIQVFALELKTEADRKKKPTEHTERQEAVRSQMAAVGCLVGVAYGLDEALAWLEGFNLLRPDVAVA